MKNFFPFLSAEGTLPDWITVSFPVIRIVLIVLLVLVSIAIIGAVLIQPAQSDGLGAIAGQSGETYYSKHKKQSLEGVVKKITVILGAVAAFISILFFVTLVIYPVAL